MMGKIDYLHKNMLFIQINQNIRWLDIYEQVNELFTFEINYDLDSNHFYNLKQTLLSLFKAFLGEDLITLANSWSFLLNSAFQIVFSKVWSISFFSWRLNKGKTSLWVYLNLSKALSCTGDWRFLNLFQRKMAAAMMIASTIHEEGTKEVGNWEVILRIEKIEIKRIKIIYE